MSANEQKSGIFELIYSAQLKRQNNSDSQIAVYYYPCNQNTNNQFGLLKQKEIRKLTFVIVSKLFLANRPIPSFLFQVLFVNFLSYFAVKYVQQLEEISKSSKYCLGYILKRQKVLNDRMKLEQSDVILKIQHSGGTSTSSCLVHKMMTNQIDKKTKQKQTNRLISDLLQS